jgi:hypothetical protein
MASLSLFFSLWHNVRVSTVSPFPGLLAWFAALQTRKLAVTVISCQKSLTAHIFGTYPLKTLIH